MAISNLEGGPALKGTIWNLERGSGLIWREEASCVAISSLEGGPALKFRTWREGVELFGRREAVE